MNIPDELKDRLKLFVQGIIDDTSETDSPGTHRQATQLLAYLEALPGDSWISVKSSPTDSEPVLCVHGKRRFVGRLVGEKELPSNGDYDDGSIYDEQTDSYWCPAGWYEKAADHEDVSWWKCDDPDHWQPLPQPPREPL